ncbi:uncharacterized protein EHS24_008975 [Apiotrichum porosum]|uniref:Uncharacterized protein n=1 Tax=Apiotrichum porosum TaxID=105984 RepID=A0A427XNP8_9TREE|nr:uncharacterized protein EHS24_008975 [Apiotrichum porosum]RSH80398.1 hypothetical protein EHS24_008975 [Apiotrichum porosum]
MSQPAAADPADTPFNTLRLIERREKLAVIIREKNDLQDMLLEEKMQISKELRVCVRDLADHEMEMARIKRELHAHDRAVHQRKVLESIEKESRMALAAAMPMSKRKFDEAMVSASASMPTQERVAGYFRNGGVAHTTLADHTKFMKVLVDLHRSRTAIQSQSLDQAHAQPPPHRDSTQPPFHLQAPTMRSPLIPPPPLPAAAPASATVTPIASTATSPATTTKPLAAPQSKQEQLRLYVIRWREVINYERLTVQGDPFASYEARSLGAARAEVALEHIEASLSALHSAKQPRMSAANVVGATDAERDEVGAHGTHGGPGTRTGTAA